MSFFWPWLLLLLLFIPLAIFFYRRKIEAPAKAAVLHPNLALLLRAKQSVRHSPMYVPAILYTLALAAGIVALARPAFSIPQADPRAGIVLTLDVSRSMMATDINPNRFNAAREALIAFVEGLPEGTRVGLVTFARYATTVVPLTDDHDSVVRAVNFLQMDFGTAIGSGIEESLRVLPTLEEREEASEDPQRLATMVLLSDGRSVIGADPLEVTEEAVDQKVTVHTIGVGSVTDGPVPGLPPRYQYAARFDEETLRAIADRTGGEYHFVDSAAELKRTYEQIGRSLVFSTRFDEVSGGAALLSAFFLISSLALSHWRRQVL
ncbi:MAG: vWA domain-containing protein [Trueperaceae bacterium]